jgi:pyruvate,water dikinase
LFVTRDKLISKIKKCYESVFSDKVRDYCNYKKIDIKSVNMAIVVQKMVMSDISGVCFTQNPMNYNKDEIMIEA